MEDVHPNSCFRVDDASDKFTDQPGSRVAVPYPPARVPHVLSEGLEANAAHVPPSRTLTLPQPTYSEWPPQHRQHIYDTHTLCDHHDFNFPSRRPRPLDPSPAKMPTPRSASPVGSLRDQQAEARRLKVGSHAREGPQEKAEHRRTATS